VPAPRRARTPQALGFRSGLEEVVAQQLLGAHIPVVYESHVVVYEAPATKHKYTPDFVLPNGIIIETKGRFLTADRKKHKLIKAQHPDLDVRFVFSNSKSKIGKLSSTTYALWCQQFGFKYADRLIPLSWLREAPTPARMAALAALQVK
jgi:hypothetical protein